MKVKLLNVRASFLHVFRKQPPAIGTDGKPAFAGHFLFEPGSDSHKKISEAIKQVAIEKWGAKAGEMIASLKNKDQLCLHKGTEKAIKYPDYEGMLYVSARSQVRPRVVDELNQLLAEEDGKPYSGAWVNAVLDVYVSTTGKTWITAQLMGVQFVKDGDAFGGGRPASEDDFDNIAVADAGNDPFEDDVQKAVGSDLL